MGADVKFIVNAWNECNMHTLGNIWIWLQHQTQVRERILKQSIKHDPENQMYKCQHVFTSAMPVGHDKLETRAVSIRVRVWYIA